jgi:membrane protease YdiL (CAAX protease family)
MHKIGLDFETFGMSNTFLRQGETARYNMIRGPNGLRAGWRLLIFFAILLPLGYAANRIIDSIMQARNADVFTPLGGTIILGGLASTLLLTAWIMGRIEGRSLADYGLPWRRALCLQFWQGAAFSFASLTALLLVLRLASAFSFGSPALHGADIWKYAAAWTVPLFLAALVEDFFYRGYLLFTLTTGIGFWPAAVVTSLLMGGAHYFNPGGHGLGPVAATLYCLVTCLVVRRTGDLWMPLGIHSAWSWGEVFLYGVPSSGQVAHGHLLNASFHGPAWLTGGAFGPEASWLNIALLVIWWFIFSAWLRGVKYPNPAAIPDPRMRILVPRTAS